MSSDWISTTWGELATLEYGKALRGYESFVGPYPVYGTNGPIGWHNSAIDSGPSVIIGRKGAYRGVHYAPGPFFVIDTAFYLKAKRSFDMRWAYYQLLTQDINGMDSGSAIPSTSRDAFYQLPVKFPPPNEQERISGILGALDDKIDLNRQTNRSLEQIACAIFKSWFVDFAPVKAKLLAKIEGRDPLRAAMYSISGKTDAEFAQLYPKQFNSLVATAALFPDEFIDSELGEIPRGWEIATIGSITERCGGGVQTGPFGSQLHASDYVDCGLPVVMPQDIIDRRIRTDKIARISEEDAHRLSRHRLQTGDIVFSRRGDVEKHALVSSREEGWVCGTGCLLVRLGPNWPAPAYVSQSLDIPASRIWLRNHAIGATMPNLNTGILSSLPLVVATEPLVKAYQEKVDSIDAYINHNNEQSETLARLRDALLPKLLSGQLSTASIDESE